MGTCVHFSRSLPSNSWWQTMAGWQALSRPSAAEGGGRRPAFTGLATQPYSATEVDGWQHKLSRVSQNRAAVQATTLSRGRLGFSPAAAVSGRSRATSWSAPVLLVRPTKTNLLRYPATATLPSWVEMGTTRVSGRLGFSPAAAVSGRSRVI